MLPVLLAPACHDSRETRHMFAMRLNIRRYHQLGDRRAVGAVTTPARGFGPAFLSQSVSQSALDATALDQTSLDTIGPEQGRSHCVYGPNKTRADCAERFRVY